MRLPKRKRETTTLGTGEKIMLIGHVTHAEARLTTASRYLTSAIGHLRAVAYLPHDFTDGQHIASALGELMSLEVEHRKIFDALWALDQGLGEQPPFDPDSLVV